MDTKIYYFWTNLGTILEPISEPILMPILEPILESILEPILVVSGGLRRLAGRQGGWAIATGSELKV